MVFFDKEIINKLLNGDNSVKFNVGHVQKNEVETTQDWNLTSDAYFFSPIAKKVSSSNNSDSLPQVLED